MSALSYHLIASVTLTAMCCLFYFLTCHIKHLQCAPTPQPLLSFFSEHLLVFIFSNLFFLHFSPPQCFLFSLSPPIPPSLTALYSISSIWSRAISARRALICWLVLSWFTTTLFLMFRARLAYFSVFSVSMKSRSDGLMQAIINVWLERKEMWRFLDDCAYSITMLRMS